MAKDKWSGFVGAAKRIEDMDLPRIGHEISVGEDVIHAILDVESSGSGFDSKNRPKMLFEPHIFYRQLGNTPAREKAVKSKLAYPKWRRNYPSDSYPRLYRAMAINETAALRSASWGLGQVMGFNVGACGYNNVQSFVKAMMADEDNHLEAMIAFIQTNNLDDELRALENAKNRSDRISAAAAFARGYNGSGYAKNRYHIRIANRLDFWRGKPDTKWKPTDAIEEDLENDIEIQYRETLHEEVVETIEENEKPIVPVVKDIAEPAPDREKAEQAVGGAVVGGLAATAAIFWNTIAGWVSDAGSWITSLVGG